MTTPPLSLPKAAPDDFPGRFREIISDPLNLLIERDPRAGYIGNQHYVVLHNGIAVPFEGPDAYCGTFSHILIFNRGVHEPLEEYVFQEMLRQLPEAPVMLELGAYWGHYSMWVKRKRPAATVYLVEAEAAYLEVGVKNFRRNRLDGEFIQAFVGKGQFGVDAFLTEKGLARLDVLHADIQGFEDQMLADCAGALSRHAIDYVFVSTHSQELHRHVVDVLLGHGYRVEVSSDFDHDSTSFDGLVFASSPDKPAVFDDFRPLGRTDLLGATPQDVVLRLAETLHRRPGPDEA